MSFQPFGPFPYEGGDPHARPGAAAPPPPPARMTGAGPQAAFTYTNPQAQQALLLQHLGIDPNNRSPLTQFMESMYTEHLRPWLGAMVMTGRGIEETPQMIAEYANAARGGNFSDFMRGGRDAFLNNPTLTGALGSMKDQRQAQRRLEDILGFADVGYDPLFASARESQREAAGGQHALALASGAVPHSTRLLDFILGNPEYSWMVGR